MKWLLLLGGAAVAAAVAYRIEDPFLRRRDPWADYDRLLRLRGAYER